MIIQQEEGNIPEAAPNRVASGMLLLYAVDFECSLAFMRRQHHDEVRLANGRKLHFQVPHRIMTTVAAAVLADIYIPFNRKTFPAHFTRQFHGFGISTIVRIGIIILSPSTGRECFAGHNRNGASGANRLIVKGETGTPVISNMVV